MKFFKFSKLGCWMIGWDHNILQRCGEASQRQFRKLVSAITIMMIIWGTIGYCFADNYINIESLLGKCCVSLAFIFLIVCIERIIILTVGKARFMATMRVCLAALMAVLGSCIFDQIIFRNDIKEALALNREKKIKEVVKQRVEILDDDIVRIELAMDSLSKNIQSLSDEVAQHPVIKTTNVTSSKMPSGQVDDNGRPIMVNTSTLSEQSFANPKTTQLNTSMQLYEKYTSQVDSLTKSKMNIQDTVIEEFNKKDPGFLEELQATFDMVIQSWITLAFYLVLFCVLLFLELFVVSIKFGDTKCDYDLLVERQLNVKQEVLQKMEEELLSTNGSNLKI